jgi:hypothetical protein
MSSVTTQRRLGIVMQPNLASPARAAPKSRSSRSTGVVTVTQPYAGREAQMRLLRLRRHNFVLALGARIGSIQRA